MLANARLENPSNWPPPFAPVHNLEEKSFLQEDSFRPTRPPPTTLLDTPYTKFYFADMKTKTISTRLSADELSALDALAEGSGMDRSGMTRSLVRRGLQQMRLESALSSYSGRQVSLGRAAELAGVSTWDFLAHMAAQGGKLQYDQVEFEEDLHAQL